MKILLINSHHKINGGAERYYFDLSQLLTSKGHKVAYFSMLDNENIKTRWKKYFVSKVDFTNNDLISFVKKISRIFYSLEAKRKIGKLLDAFKPDIVHIQNIYYYISPSILSEIKKRGIPIVQTVHDYQLISPNVTLFSNGKINEETKIRKYYKAFIGKSVKGARGASFMATLLSYFQDAFNLHKKNIDLFIAPSNFMKSKLVEYGFNRKKIVKLDNFVEGTKIKYKTSADKYILYFGRINEAKGILLLLDAAQQLPGIKFKVAGNFEDENIKGKVLEKVRKEKIKNVKFLGFVTGYSLTRLVRNCYFCIVPSLWYENQPYSILESFAQGKTVVASRIGGIPEIVRDGKDGLLFEPGNVNQFVRKIKKLWDNPVLARNLGQNARKLVNEKYNPGVHYQKIMAIYKKILAK